MCVSVLDVSLDYKLLERKDFALFIFCHNIRQEQVLSKDQIF